jgi:hypothetical protein
VTCEYRRLKSCNMVELVVEEEDVPKT